MKQSGFTLIELLVVIAIIGLLASVVLVSLNRARISSRDGVRKANLRQLQSALELYYSTNSAYPSTGGVWRSSEPGDLWNPDPSNYIPGLAPSFVPKLPADPQGGPSVISVCTAVGSKKAYLYISNGTNYKLLAHCSIEGAVSASDPFYDPVRPTWAWQVSSAGAINW
jgi:prepilin-type N-terminal cleavage/methylation domain-containing protein